MPPRITSLGWGTRLEGRSVWTRNAVRGSSVRGERRKKDGRIEWRKWDAHRSKVAAAILRTRGDPVELLPKIGSRCLYLGASSGGTVSHIHDIVCGSGNHHSGQVVAVEISPRMVRDLVSVSSERVGLVPVLGDAKIFSQISPFLSGKVDWIHQDLSMTDQAQNFVKASEFFLRSGGTGLLSLKAASERASDGDDSSMFDKAQDILNSSKLKLIERIDLSGLEEQHVVFYCRI